MYIYIYICICICIYYNMFINVIIIEYFVSFQIFKYIYMMIMMIIYGLLCIKIGSCM